MKKKKNIVPEIDIPDDYIVRMKPRKYKVRVKIKSVKKGKLKLKEEVI